MISRALWAILCKGWVSPLKKLLASLLAAASIAGSAVCAFAADDEIIPSNILIGQLYYNGSWYYEDENDERFLLQGFQKIDGKRYYFDEDGSLHKGWLTVDDKTYYCDRNGRIVTGKEYIDLCWYRFDTNGILVETLGHIDTTAGIKRDGDLESDPLAQMEAEYTARQIHDKAEEILDRDSFFYRNLTEERLTEKLERAREKLEAAEDALAAVEDTASKTTISALEEEVRNCLDDVEIYEGLLEDLYD